MKHTKNMKLKKWTTTTKKTRNEKTTFQRTHYKNFELNFLEQTMKNDHQVVM